MLSKTQHRFVVRIIDVLLKQNSLPAVGRLHLTESRRRDYSSGARGRGFFLVVAERADTNIPNSNIIEESSQPTIVMEITRRIGLVGLAVLVVLVIANSGLSDLGRDVQSPPASPAAASVKSYSLPANDTKSQGLDHVVPERGVYRTTAHALYAEYSANEVAANQRIGNARVELTGVVTAIEQDSKGQAILRLSSDDIVSVGVTLENSQTAGASTLKKGQKVTVMCDSVRMLIWSPTASDCVFAD